MKIAQIAPLAEAVPPRLYGGTERIVSYLSDELVRQGHEVTVFATGDSQTRAEARGLRTPGAAPGPSGARSGPSRSHDSSWARRCAPSILLTH